VTAADDPTLGGLLGPEPKRAEGEVEDIRVRIALRNAAKAQARYLDAKADRRGVIAEALDEGCSFREVAQAMGLSVSTVHNLRPNRPLLPNAVTVPGKTLADDAADHDRDQP
jgi:hypothetical protein